MTIAFMMLLLVPEPREQSHTWESITVEGVIHFRPDSKAVDAVVQLIYVFFAGAACYDSTWGTLLSAEWGVRAPIVPATKFEVFLSRLMDLNKFGSLEKGATFNRFAFGKNFLERLVGYHSYSGWDPYYSIDRNVLSLFLCACCFLYLTQGVLHSLITLCFFVSLRCRVKRTVCPLAKAALPERDDWDAVWESSVV